MSICSSLSLYPRSLPRSRSPIHLRTWSSTNRQFLNSPRERYEIKAREIAWLQKAFEEDDVSRLGREGTGDAVDEANGGGSSQAEPGSTLLSHSKSLVRRAAFVSNGLKNDPGEEVPHSGSSNQEGFAGRPLSHSRSLVRRTIYGMNRIEQNTVEPMLSDRPLLRKGRLLIRKSAIDLPEYTTMTEGREPDHDSTLEFRSITLGLFGVTLPHDKIISLQHERLRPIGTIAKQDPETELHTPVGIFARLDPEIGVMSIRQAINYFIDAGKFLVRKPRKRWDSPIQPHEEFYIVPFMDKESEDNQLASSQVKPYSTIGSRIKAIEPYLHVRPGPLPRPAVLTFRLWHAEPDVFRKKIMLCFQLLSSSRHVHVRIEYVPHPKEAKEFFMEKFLSSPEFWPTVMEKAMPPGTIFRDEQFNAGEGWVSWIFDHPNMMRRRTEIWGKKSKTYRLETWKGWLSHKPIVGIRGAVLKPLDFLSSSTQSAESDANHPTPPHPGEAQLQEKLVISSETPQPVTLWEAPRKSRSLLDRIKRPRF